VALIQLIMVINPRIKRREKQDDLPEINPTYFKGIVSFESASEYGKYLRKIMDNDSRSYTMFANQVYSVASINEYKHGHMQKAIRFFAVAIISELLIVMSVAYTRSLPFLFGG
ncbi:MAG: Pycsar system effector family protein, partial [Candidatus Neomarinimicrobiota bacterium]|nr:Pycsar system effector family protein [Candidatus Neomarinimicrobiota bacterium]MED5256959.1 Pycsar system effector family protein [Candidatus Neomarinimicrobiota bacterium]